MKNDDYIAGYYYACGRNDAFARGGEGHWIDPDTFAAAYAERRADRSRSAPSVQGFYRDFPR